VTAEHSPEAGSAVAIVHDLWDLFDQQRWDDARLLLADDFTATLPDTREVFPSADAWIEFNRRYPGRWRIEILRTVTEDDQVVTETSITDADTEVRAASFWTVTDGRIAAVTEYYVEPGTAAPPFDRSDLTAEES
jgi:ketosteroid isomerase-like protein